MPASASVAPAGTRAEPTAFEPENSRIADYSIDNTVEVGSEFVLFGFSLCARVRAWNAYIVSFGVRVLVFRTVLTSRFSGAASSRHAPGCGCGPTP